MKQYNVTHDTHAWNAYKAHYGENCSVYDFMKGCHVQAIGSKQAWILTDSLGNKWLQSYNTIVSVKWADTGAVEHFGKWSVTTSRHQSTFARMV